VKKGDIVAIIVLSLIVWLLFWFESMPLDSGSTLGVVVVCTALVLAFGWMRNRFKKEPKA
jgi:hypothetical protein